MASAISSDFQETCLDEEIPDPTSFVHIDLDEVTGFPSTKFTSSTSVFSYEDFFNNKIRFWKDAEL